MTPSHVDYMHVKTGVESTSEMSSCISSTPQTVGNSLYNTGIIDHLLPQFFIQLFVLILVNIGQV
jgi:hypothetical protein